MMSERDEVAAAYARRDFLLANVREVEGPLETKCLVWQRAIGGKGYGRVWYKGSLYYPHRLFYILAHGPFPDDLFCCHRCDVQLCCNASHLFPGTPSDNYQDMAAKGRGLVGELNGQAILTDADVSNIKGLLLDPWPSQIAELARRYGVSWTTIYCIKTGRSWPHIAPNPNAVIPSLGPTLKIRRIA
jgi:hypothetical protein